MTDPNLETDVVLSKIRQYPNLSTFVNFGETIQVTLSAAKHIVQASLEVFARYIALTDFDDVVVSDMFMNEEVESAKKK